MKINSSFLLFWINIWKNDVKEDKDNDYSRWWWWWRWQQPTNIQDTDKNLIETICYWPQFNSLGKAKEEEKNLMEQRLSNLCRRVVSCVWYAVFFLFLTTRKVRKNHMEKIIELFDCWFGLSSKRLTKNTTLFCLFLYNEFNRWSLSLLLLLFINIII